MKREILGNTLSLCPVCLKKIEADYVSEDDKIYMVKNCQEHGSFKTLVWEGVNHWQEWVRPLANITSAYCETKIGKGCPYDCGICPDHKQLTCCVLLEVTDNCNLGCPVCFASAKENDSENPSLETIEGWYENLLHHGGPYNIQLSGGEPTMRDDLAEIILMGKKMGFSFFQLNTNGLRISQDLDYLKGLADAGLSTVFLQFDSMEDSAYQILRGRPLLEVKMKAIENCRKIGMGVVLVPTVKMGVNLNTIGSIIDFAFNNRPIIKGVHFQPISYFGRYDSLEERVTIPRLLSEIEKQTNGEIKMEYFMPGGAEHFLCSFHGDFIKDDEGIIHPIKKESKFCSSKQAMDVVAEKWQHQLPITEQSALLNTDSLDAFLHKRKTQTLAISGMAFQDVWNIDLARLKRCYIHEVSPGGKIIPFCAYNLTSVSGESLYRGKDNV